MAIEPIVESGIGEYTFQSPEVTSKKVATTAPFSIENAAKAEPSPDAPETRTQSIATRQFACQQVDSRTAILASNDWIRTISADPSSYAKWVKVSTASAMHLKVKENETEQERAYWGHLHMQFKALIAELRNEQ